VLWNGGISFGGVIAFLFADLLIFPILNIYRKYYGLKVASILAVVFYIAMVGAALVVEGLFGALHLIPVARNAMVMTQAITFNYTSVLNLFFLLLSVLLLVRFLKTGGPAMLREMGGGPPDPTAAPHHCCGPEPVIVTAEHSCCGGDVNASPAPPAASSCCSAESASPKDSCCGGAEEPEPASKTHSRN